MENQTSKSKRGRVIIGIIIGFAVGFVTGFISGAKTSPLEMVKIIVGLICLLIIVIVIYWFIRSRRKKE